MTSPEEDRAVELRAQTLAGDQAARDELLTQLQPLVLRRCSRILPHRPDAEEAAQDALMSVITHLDEWGGRGSFLGWVTVIAANSARATYRSMRRRFAESASAELPAATPDPRTTSVIAGSRLDLLDAIEHLEADRPAAVEAFVLRDLGGLTYEEVAERTGASLSAVKSRIHEARLHVRERLRVTP